MAYLFWAFAAVWLALFIYLYGLVRRSRALEERLAELLDRAHSPDERGQARGASGPAGAAGPIEAGGGGALKRPGAGTGG